MKGGYNHATESLLEIQKEQSFLPKLRPLNSHQVVD